MILFLTLLIRSYNYILSLHAGCQKKLRQLCIRTVYKKRKDLPSNHTATQPRSLPETPMCAVT